MTKLGHREVKPGKQGFGFTCWLSGKESAHQCRRHRLDPWLRKIPWKKWQPTAVFLPGKSHGQRSLSGYSPWGHKESDMTKWLTHTLVTSSQLDHLQRHYFQIRSHSQGLGIRTVSLEGGDAMSTYNILVPMKSYVDAPCGNKRQK